MVILRVSGSERTFLVYASDTHKFIEQAVIFRVMLCLKFWRRAERLWDHEFHQHISDSFSQFLGEDEKQGLYHGPGEGLTFGEMSVFNSHHLTSVSN